MCLGVFFLREMEQSRWCWGQAEEAPPLPDYSPPGWEADADSSRYQPRSCSGTRCPAAGAHPWVSTLPLRVVSSTRCWDDSDLCRVALCLCTRSGTPEHLVSGAGLSAAPHLCDWTGAYHVRAGRKCPYRSCRRALILM